MMSKPLRTTLIVLAIVVGAAALLLVGMNIGRAWFYSGGFWSGNGMTGFDQFDPYKSSYGMVPGMMGSYSASPLLGVDPLSLSDAEKALENYLSAVDDDELVIGEIMVFDNHAYAQLLEESTGIGAMEVLVDPVTKVVYPEYGPNMMWNLKYSPMAGFDMMGSGGMMDGFGGIMGGVQNDPENDMTVSPAQARELAQLELDKALPGTTVDEEVDSFYGYYTIHILRGGEVSGMLSVNGYTGQVWIHAWHGDFVDMTEHTQL